MPILSRPRRPARAGDWTDAKAVTYIVTLAATGSVTLAARSVGISRRSAYALKARDSGFAAAWNQALAAHRREVAQGNEVDKVDRPPVSPVQGNGARRYAMWPPHALSRSPARDSAGRDLLARRFGLA